MTLAQSRRTANAAHGWEAFLEFVEFSPGPVDDGIEEFEQDQGDVLIEEQEPIAGFVGLRVDVVKSFEKRIKTLEGLEVFQIALFDRSRRLPAMENLLRPLPNWREKSLAEDNHLLSCQSEEKRTLL